MQIGGLLYNIPSLFISRYTFVMEITKELIEANWPLTQVVIKPMPLPGKGGTVGIVEAKEGKYTCKIPGSWKTPINLDRDLDAFDFLHNKNFQYISKLLRTKDAKKFIKIGDKLIYLMEFIEGNHPEWWNTSTFSTIGKITAELHSIQGFPFESDYRPDIAISQAIEKAHKFSFKDEYIEVLKSVRPFDNLTKVLMHTEITPRNIIQKSDGSMILIDWDEVGIGPAVLDLGVSLINHFITEEDLAIRRIDAEAYYQSYFALRPMSPEEKTYIFDSGVYWACLWVEFGDIEKRWNKIKWAIENKEKIKALYK